MDYIVIIPSRNRYDLLRLAVRSALEQTLPPRAVWVVDDGSTDPRYRMAGDELADPSVHVIRSAVPAAEAHGVTYAVGAVRNHALARLVASPFDGWVAFLDDDDEWLPEKMHKQSIVAKAYRDVAAIGTDADVIDQSGTVVDHHGSVGGVHLGGAVRDVTAVVAERNVFTTSTVIVPMHVVRRTGLMVATGYPEDWDYWRRAAAHGRLLRYHHTLARYRTGHPKEWSL